MAIAIILLFVDALLILDSMAILTNLEAIIIHNLAVSTAMESIIDFREIKCNPEI